MKQLQSNRPRRLPLALAISLLYVTSPAWADDANRTANENAAASRRAGMKDMETPDEESAPTADGVIMP